MASEPETELSEPDLADSDDELEDVQQFIQSSSQNESILSQPAEGDGNESFYRHTDKTFTKSVPELLAEIKFEDAKEDELEELKNEIMRKLHQRPDNTIEDDEMNDDLTSKHDVCIKKLEVKATKLTSEHPGLNVFHPNLFCCLFTENFTAGHFGFVSSGSMMDKYIDEITADQLPEVIYSHVLQSCFWKISCLDKVLLWLWNLVSIHSSQPLVLAMGKLLRTITQQLKNRKASGQGQIQSWCPKPSDLLQLLINLGAPIEFLLEKQGFYTTHDFSPSLHKIRIDDTKPLSDEMFFQRFKFVLEVLAHCLQNSPLQNTKEISFMFFLLAKTCMHKSFQCCLGWEFETCLSSLIESYSDVGWLHSMPDLCHCLVDITDHHHNQAYLMVKIPWSVRGSFLRQRLGLLFLYRQLSTPDHNAPSLDYEILKVSDILNIGTASADETLSPLCKAMMELIKTDLYKLSSVIKILDLTVGEDSQRCEYPAEDLQHLIGQVKMVIRRIHDNMCDLDFSKIKDILSCLTLKWSVTLQELKQKQKTIFNWVSASPYKTVKPIVLKDNKMLIDNDDDDGIL